MTRWALVKDRYAPVVQVMVASESGTRAFLDLCSEEALTPLAWFDNLDAAQQAQRTWETAHRDEIEQFDRECEEEENWWDEWPDELQPEGD